MNRTHVLAVLLLAAIVALAGCKNGEPLRESVLNAAAQQDEIHNYSFSGEAELALNVPATIAANPASVALIHMLANSTLSWEGRASTEPAQAELMLHVKPSGAQEALSISALIQDNKLYVHMPALTAPGQYIMFDLLEQSAAAGTPTSGGLPGGGSLSGAMLGQLAQAIGHKQFTELDVAAEGGQSITATLNTGQVKEAVNLWFDALPPMIVHLLDAGYIQTEAADKWMASFTEEHRQQTLKNSADWSLLEPLALQVDIDEEGFVRQTTLQLDAQAGENRYKANIRYRYDDINTLEPFTLNVPEQVLPFADVLRFLNQGS